MIPIKTYKYSELTENCKHKAVHDNRLINVMDSGWCDNIITTYNVLLEEHGFMAPYIRYTNPAYGTITVCFECDTVDLDKPLWNKVCLSEFPVESVCRSVIKNHFHGFSNFLVKCVKASIDVVNHRTCMFDSVKLNNTIHSLGFECAPAMLKRYKEAAIAYIDCLETHRKTLCMEIQQALNAEYSDATSYDKVAYMLDCKEYVFLADGTEIGTSEVVQQAIKEAEYGTE